VLDREVLDLLRGDPELLAIADAIASTQAQGRRRLSGSILGRVRRTAARRRRDT
jgi:hypothetical protein